MRDSKSLEKPTISTEAEDQGDRKDRTKANNGACRQGATSQPEVNVAIEGTSKLSTAEYIQNWSETVVVENCRQDFRSETLVVNTTQVLEDEIHFGKSEHSIVQRGELELHNDGNKERALKLSIRNKQTNFGRIDFPT